MEPLGVRFKQAREAQGLSLQDIATKTKISVAVLEAVERNDFSRLPGGIFGRSFVRAYATEVGLNPDAAVSDFVDELDRSERDAAAARAAARPEITAEDQRFLDRQRHALFWLRVGVTVLVLAGLAGGTWALRSRLQSGPASDVGAPARSDTSDQPEPPARSAEVPTSTDPVVPEAIAHSGGSAESAPASGVLLVELAMSADCWISAAVDGGPSKGQLYHAGDRVRLDATREVLLEVGNAGAVAMTIGGKLARPLGKSGATSRLRITHENAASWVGE